MSEMSAPSPNGAAWWARLPSGELRRIWVTKAGEFFHCAVEILTPEQEEARIRLAQLGQGPPPAEGPDRHQIALDAQLLASIRGLVARTADPREAFIFLGGDDAALGALIEADAGLASIPLEVWQLPSAPPSSD